MISKKLFTKKFFSVVEIVLIIVILVLGNQYTAYQWRKTLKTLKTELQTLKTELQTLKTELQTLKTEVIDELRTKGCTIQDKDGVKITIVDPYKE